jgi:hypothetical protein
MRSYLSFALALTLVGCTTDQSCASRPSDPLCQDVDAGTIRDVGTSDVGADGGPTNDARMPCGGACPGTMHCLAATDTCVACLGNGDCGGTTPTCDTADHTCVGCVIESDCTGGSHCEATSQTCVACLDSTQCTTAAGARCDTSAHTCAACVDSTDCAHLTATPICGSGGTCVQCTASNETACGANSCNPTTSTCTTTPRTTIATCHACVADSECMTAMDRCVPMQFMGASHGSYCLHPVSAGCTRPFTVTSTARASTSGVAAEPYCGVEETVTTCEAVLALVADTACTTAADCGAGSLDDGRCVTVSGVMNRCTYSCGGAVQCPLGFMCGAMGYCGSP